MPLYHATSTLMGDLSTIAHGRFNTGLTSPISRTLYEILILADNIYYDDIVFLHPCQLQTMYSMSDIADNWNELRVAETASRGRKPFLHQSYIYSIFKKATFHFIVEDSLHACLRSLLCPSMRQALNNRIKESLKLTFCIFSSKVDPL